MLTDHQKKHLRGLGHKLKPVVMVGDAGLSGSLLEEYESTLEHHELIKVSVRVGDREARDNIISQLCSDSGAELVQRIGNTALVYRRNAEKPKILLPKR
jgi:RNA-binding protein